jgi:aminopeptidase N
MVFLCVWSAAAGGERGGLEVDCGHAGIAIGRSFDAQSGRDPRQYPPDLPVDFLHLKLELTFRDLATQSFTGIASLTFRPVRSDLKMLTLDAVDLEIDRVTDDRGRALRFDYDDARLTIHFARALSTEADTTIRVHYKCVEPKDGMTFVLPDPARPDRPTVVHTQGETDTSRYWFPCFDFPSDRLTTEMVVSVPEPLFALSNGRLVNTSRDGKTGMTTYHWKQAVPHVCYLVTLVIGEFDVVEDEWRDVPVQYYVPVGKSADARRTFARTPDVIAFFSRITGVDYPYEKYAQVTVPQFKFGGMENTTATTLIDHALLDKRAMLDADMESLIAHELAHQWYGDLITCRSWPHVWLNEGFATFFASAWLEESKGRDEYLYEFWTRIQGVASADQTDTPGAVVHYNYTTTFEPFFHKGSLAYSKGACILHMLRHQLGESVFWPAIAAYTQRFSRTQVETDQLRRILEAKSGRNLEQFFEQWAYRPGVPHVKVTYQWHAESQMVEVKIEQTQHIDAATPAFRFPLDLYFRSGGEVSRVTVEVNQRTDAYRRRFDTPPDLFVVDPDAGLLMKLECEKPRKLWRTQLADGPTTMARIVAARNLSKHGRPEIIAALGRIVGDDSEQWMIRSEAAGALGSMQTNSALDELLSAVSSNAIADHRTRNAVVQAIGQYRSAEAIALVRRFAESAPSYIVEASATRALGRMRDRDGLETLIRNTRKSSPWDKIRTAAIESLADLNIPAAIPPVEECTTSRYHERTRQVAIRALGRLGNLRNHRDDIRDSLIDYLNDPLDWVVWGAVEGLALIGDDASRSAIVKRMQGFTTSRTQMAARSALKRIDRKQPPVSALRNEQDALRTKVLDLEERLEKMEVTAP